MKIIAIANQKGGTGKTSTTVHLGAALVRAGMQVLLVDLDPQACFPHPFSWVYERFSECSLPPNLS
jgi:chromosome partitioning protein